MLASALVVCSAGFFAIMGLVAFTDPLRVWRYFGVETITPDGRSEVRAVYGGFGLAIAALLGATRLGPRLPPGIVLTVAIAVAGMAAGRLVSLAIDRTWGRWPRVFLAVELVLAAALGAAAWLEG